MRAYSLTHLTDAVLDHDLPQVVSRERSATAVVLAYLAEFDARRRYAPAGYPSMYAYCVEHLGLSEDSAYKRIRAARVARRFPSVFAAVADGRLHLSAVVLLAPHLTEENAAELLRDATRKSKSQVEEMLARRFPRTELLPMVQVLPPAEASCSELAPGPVRNGAAAVPAVIGAPNGAPEVQAWAHAPGHVRVPGNGLAPGPVATPAPQPKLAPHAPGRYRLELTIGRDMHEKLRHAQALLSHSIPSGDLAAVLDLALDALIPKLEKRKFAGTSKPRPRRSRSNTNPRHIPAHVKRAVWKRDGGRCTFVGEHGHRCNARRFLEYDHVDPVARGGQATVAGLRLRCRAHNQLGAERAFGVEFMAGKREAARRAAVARCGAARRRPSTVGSTP